LKICDSGVPARPVNLLQGLRRRLAGAGVETVHYRAVPLVPGFERQGSPLGESNCLFADAEGRQPGPRAEVFHNPDFAGAPATVSDRVGLDLFWNLYQPIPPIPAENASIRWQGFLRALATGPHHFTLEIIGGVRLTARTTTPAPSSSPCCWTSWRRNRRKCGRWRRRMRHFCIMRSIPRRNGFTTTSASTGAGSMIRDRRTLMAGRSGRWAWAWGVPRIAVFKSCPDRSSRRRCRR